MKRAWICYKIVGWDRDNVETEIVFQEPTYGGSISYDKIVPIVFSVLDEEPFSVDI